MEQNVVPDGAELELRGYLDVLRRRWRTVLVVVLAFVALALGLSLQQEKQYTASVDLLIEPRSTETIFSSDANAAASAAQNADRRLNNEVRAINSGTTREAVEKAYRGALDPDAVSARVSGAVTDAVVVSLTASDPEEAAELVNLYVEEYIRVRRQQRIDELLAAGSEVQQQIDDLAGRIATVRAPLTEVEDRLSRSPSDAALQARRDDLAVQLAADLEPLESQRAFYQQALEDLTVSAGIVGTGGARILTEAEVPTDPVSPKPVRSAAVALFLGGVVGIVVAFVADTLDERIRGVSDLERAAPGVPALALIPEIPPKAPPSYVAVRDDPQSSVAEAFRTLRTSVKFTQLDSPVRVIQVTSALPGEGKTTTVANLATALVQGGERVAVVCSDLRRPNIHKRFDAPLRPGLTDVLLHTVSLAEALRPLDDRLFLLPAGTLPPNPSELLSSHRAAKVIAALAAEFDVVLLDSTPVLPVTDAVVVSRFVDATLIVVDTRTTKRRPLRQAVQTLNQASAPVVGLVLTGTGGSSGFGYEYGYGYGYPAAETAVTTGPPAA